MSLDPSPTPLAPQGYAMMLRQAREAKGVNIDFLASVLRVPVDRLRALEEDRLQDLPDLIFARALAQSMCRQLKIDSVAVLASMPDPDLKRSVRITAATCEPLGGMNTHAHVMNKRMIWAGVVVVLVGLWAVLGSHLWDDQHPSTSVQSPAAEPTADAVMPPANAEPNAAATTTESNAAAPSAHGGTVAPTPINAKP